MILFVFLVLFKPARQHHGVCMFSYSIKIQEMRLQNLHDDLIFVILIVSYYFSCSHVNNSKLLVVVSFILPRHLLFSKLAKTKADDIN